jgi:predicted TIM-barrel fold metal-dependent hydrolase
VDRRTITYAVLVAATLALTWQLTADERDRLFYRNTVRTYRINGPITNQTLRVWGLR